ncbi:MAG: DUF1959 family protein [Methanomicrobiaceae archaeon]|nr:DUF1959 family protein [Methanomicrobiaceae archaeon]
MEFLYEKDLTAMKFRILTSSRHDAVLTQLAERLGISKQEIRKAVMRRFDMILLENIPARYEAARAEEAGLDQAARELGAGLLTRYLPLVPKEEMEKIVREAEEAISEGKDPSLAIAEAKEAIREVIRE